MAKPKIQTNHIAFELDSLRSKVHEFRTYLDKTKVSSIHDDNQRHNEIKIQLLILEKLTPILSSLDDLEKKAEKEADVRQSKDIRGDAKLSPLEEGLLED